LGRGRRGSLSMLSDKNDLACLGGCGTKSKWYQ
jgi:hypothetical protein